MIKDPPDERLVYLALKNIFKGADAQLRDLRKIRKHIEKHQDGEIISTLIEEHTLDDVQICARKLLKEEIFESTLKAKIRFPEVFEISLAQSAEREASEAEAARSEEDAIRGIAEGHQITPSHAVDKCFDGAQQHGTKEPNHLASAKGYQTHTTSFAKGSVPALYPVYLPCTAQHRLMNKAQAILERACYAFGRRELANTLSKEGWESAECVELNIWARLFKDNLDSFDTNKIDQLGKPISDLLDAIPHLRHTAVHRHRWSANKVVQFIVDAEALAFVLCDESCLQTLTHLRREAQLAMEEFGRNKDLLESRLANKLTEIALERAELDRIEQKAIQDMLNEDRDYQALAGFNLEQAIDMPETALCSLAPSEHEMTSNSELEVSTDDFVETSLHDSSEAL